jgi:phosphate transport system substrate-binding protein
MITSAHPTAELGNAAGEFVAPSGQAAGRMVLGAKNTGTEPDLHLTLDHAATTAGAYPLVSVTYEILCAPPRGGAVNLLTSFLSYAASPDEQKAIESLGYASLPHSLRPKVLAALDPPA